LETKVGAADTCFVLATDLDNTLVGDRDRLNVLNDLLSSRRSSVRLIYLTGRNVTAAWELISQENLLLPDVLVTDVGTEVRWAADYRLDEEWDGMLAEKWHPDRVSLILSYVEGLIPQQLDTRLRRSYVIEGRKADKVIREVKRFISQSMLPLQVIASSGRDVDILPLEAGKGAALAYICRKIALNVDNIVVCGDSGNDLSMFMLGFKGIIVGNAQPELTGIALPGKVYRAGSSCAGGILEGLRHFGMTGA